MAPGYIKIAPKIIQLLTIRDPLGCDVLLGLGGDGVTYRAEKGVWVRHVQAVGVDSPAKVKFEESPK